jgi:hypothetical protein
MSVDEAVIETKPIMSDKSPSANPFCEHVSISMAEIGDDGQS